MNIVLGITGSIAAYKACTLIRALVKRGHEVQVVITPAGKEFITPITLSALTSKPVISDFFAQRDGTWHSHVALGLWADVMVIAPATASTIGKMAHGIADNMLITTYLSMKAPVYVAPAMDLDMWAHPSTQDNLRLLRERGVKVIEPGSGFLASHLEGKGRMEEPERIAEIICDGTESTEKAEDTEERGGKEAPLDGKDILITAGPTYEKIDPVRFIGNYSSGKMGIALAKECVRQGAQVTMVLGPVDGHVRSEIAGNSKINIIDVESAQDMWEAATSHYPTADAGILCAAVADFTPDTVAQEKIKREDVLALCLRPTKDIARSLGEMKKEDQFLVGFALETNDELEHAREKMRRKNLDFIVLNSLNDPGAGFRHDTNKVTIVTPEEEITYPLKSKEEVAADIVAQLIRVMSKSRLATWLLTLCLWITASLLAVQTAQAQELKAQVIVNHSQVSNTKTGVFDALKDKLTQLLNERAWTNMQYREAERIQCSFNINVSKWNEADNAFTASLIVSAVRPVYNSGYTSTVLSMNDKDFSFTFAEFDQLEWRPDQVDNNLTAMIAYWAYLIIGLDMDSFAPMAGTDILRLAQQVCIDAEGLGFSGWKAFSDSKNRYAIVNDYLDGAMEKFRQLQYKYYREGLDIMAESTERGRAAISECIDLLEESHKDKSLSLLPQLFTEYKKDELVSIFQGQGTSKEREHIYDILFKINPSQSTAWEKIKN